MIDTADAAAGEVFYNAGCAGCHGEPASAGNVGAPSGGILEYLKGDGKFSEFAHAARWGITGTIMIRGVMATPSSKNIADILL